MRSEYLFTQLEEEWRNKLDAIWLQYQISRDPKTMQEYRGLLRQFSDLVLRAERPATDED